MTNKMLIGWWVCLLLTKRDSRVFPPASTRTARYSGWYSAILTSFPVPSYTTCGASDFAHFCILLAVDTDLFDDRIYIKLAQTLASSFLLLG